jgi:hypothetical protein
MNLTYQHPFLYQTHLSLRGQSLYVRRSNSQWQPALELAVPFEEILPLRTEKVRHVPKQRLIGLLFMLAWIGQDVVRHATPDFQFTTELQLYAGIILLIVAYCVYGWFNWWNVWHLRTPHLSLTLPDWPSRRKPFQLFAFSVEQRAHDYLRQEYADINPLGPIELQLHRLHWLHRLGVLSSRELQTLSTRLTGRLSLDPLHLMGQELESVYVN